MWPGLPPHMVTGFKGERLKRQSRAAAVSPFLTQPWKTCSTNFTTCSFLEASPSVWFLCRGRGNRCYLLMGGVSKNLQTCFKTTMVQVPLTTVTVLYIRSLFTSSTISLKEHRMGGSELQGDRIRPPMNGKIGTYFRVGHPPSVED